MKKTVLEIIAPIDADIYAFGSRSLGIPRVDSDLDLYLKHGQSQMPLESMARMREECSISILTFQVDLVDYQDLHEASRLIVEREGILTKSGPKDRPHPP